MSVHPQVDSSHWRELETPRVPPARPGELNPLLRPLVAIAGKVTGGPPPNIFTTLGRHPRLFVPWLIFASRLMPRGSLPRVDTELVILRVAWNCRSRYEWDHHVRIGAKVGLDAAAIERIAEGPDGSGWDDRERGLLRATDEMHGDGIVSDATWSQLSEHLSHRDLIELCMLIGHYEMLAMTLGSLGVQPERPLPANGG